MRGDENRTHSREVRTNHRGTITISHFPLSAATHSRYKLPLMLANNKTTPSTATNTPHEKNWEGVVAKVDRRAFRMKDKVLDILKKLYGRTALTPDENEDKVHLRTSYCWLIAPFSDWAVDFDGLARFVYSRVKRGKALDPEMRFLLTLVKDLPSEEAQEVIGDYEHIVQQGAYDQLVREDAKYIARLKELLEDPEFQADLAMLKQLFDITKFQTKDTKRIIRRTLVCERNIRFDFLFRWGTEIQRFQRIFDCFCWKHQLYGLEAGDKPLLMKLTVNPTPYGVMIFIPAWMSIDLWRDLLHTKVTELIRCRGVKRQGRKLSESRTKTQEKGLRVFVADGECTTLGITGDERLAYIIEKAGLPPKTSDRQMRRLLAVGRALMKAGSVDATAETPRITVEEAAAINAAKLAQAKAAFAALSPQDKAEFAKWQAP